MRASPHGVTGPAGQADATRWRCAGPRSMPDSDDRRRRPGAARVGSVAEFIAASARLPGADAEHGGRRRRRPHRLRRRRPGAAAQGRQRPEGPGAGAGLGRALRLGRLPRCRRDAARDRSGTRLDRHRQPAHPRRRTTRTTSPANGRRRTGSSASSNCCEARPQARSGRACARSRPTSCRWPALQAAAVRPQGELDASAGRRRPGAAGGLRRHAWRPTRPRR